MLCKCGATIPEDAKFCMLCGKRIPKPKPPVPEVADELIIKQVDPLLTPSEAARLLKISRWKLDELRIQRKLPESCYFIIPSSGRGLTKQVRFRAKELLIWAGTLEGPITTAG